MTSRPLPTGTDWIETRGDTVRFLRWGYHVGSGEWMPFWQTVDELRPTMVIL